MLPVNFTSENVKLDGDTISLKSPGVKKKMFEVHRYLWKALSHVFGAWIIFDMMTHQDLGTVPNKSPWKIQYDFIIGKRIRSDCFTKFGAIGYVSHDFD